MARIIFLPLTVRHARFLYPFLWKCKSLCENDEEKSILNAVIIALNEEMCR